jgi:hypothetical protein
MDAEMIADYIAAIDAWCNVSPVSTIRFGELSVSIPQTPFDEPSAGGLASPGSNGPIGLD